MDDTSPAVTFFRRMQTLANLFRFVELCILLAFLSWISTSLPFAVRISGEYFRRFAGLILSPTAVFLAGNAIFVTLLVKSGLFSPETSSIDNAVVNLLEQLRSDVLDDQVTQEIVYQDKEMISDELNTKIVIPIPNNEEEDVEKVKASYRRSRSEIMRRNDTDEEMKTNQKNLRRSETDICRKEFAGEDDDVSNEEFQRTIEDFIARQVRFHREERLAVVLHAQV